jgi:hypothetical protein
MNEGETFCSSDNEHKFCNKMHGDWGDSIPQTGEYCIWGILEFEDPEGFFDDPARDAMFSAIFQNEVRHLSEDEDLQDKWLFAAGTGGIGGGDFSAPWPYSSIVWKNGNEFAKQFISDRHRINAQEPGLGMGWTFHGHYKAVKCAEVWPTLEANGLKQDNFRGPAHRTFQGVLFPEGNNYLNLWNAFSDIKSHHEDFYPKDTCHVGPCPGDGTPPDAIVEDDESSLLIKESRLLGWLREFWWVYGFHQLVNPPQDFVATCRYT